MARLVQERAGDAKDPLHRVGICAPRGAEVVKHRGLGCKQVGVVTHELVNAKRDGVRGLVQEVLEMGSLGIEAVGGAREEAFKPRDEAPRLERDLLLLFERMLRVPGTLP